MFDINDSLTYDPTRATPLCEIMGRHGSDKGNATNTGHHNYTTYYHKLFAPIANLPLRVFELGLGTNNVNVPSNMGANGKPGASLRGWKEFFPNASICGADIDSGILFEEDRISTIYCDQTSPSSIAELWSQDKNRDQFDILIEDGLHEFHANKCFFENSFHMVKKGGVYIIEDVIVHRLRQYQAQIEQWKAAYPTAEFHIVNLPSERNRVDNCLIVIFNN
jgi:hypothetical protein